MNFKLNSDEILNALPRPILVIDENYTIVSANRASCEAFSLPLENIVGRRCHEISHNLERPCWQENIGCPVKTAFEQKKRARIVHKHTYAGRDVFEEISAAPIMDDDGKVAFIVEELNDITELMKSKELIEHFKNEVQTLQGFIPICSSCRQIRDDKGFWQQIEEYFIGRTEAEFSHSICPECMKKLYPEYVTKSKCSSNDIPDDISMK